MQNVSPELPTSGNLLHNTEKQAERLLSKTGWKFGVTPSPFAWAIGASLRCGFRYLPNVSDALEAVKLTQILFARQCIVNLSLGADVTGTLFGQSYGDLFAVAARNPDGNSVVCGGP